MNDWWSVNANVLMVGFVFISIVIWIIQDVYPLYKKHREPSTPPPKNQRNVQPPPPKRKLARSRSRSNTVSFLPEFSRENLLKGPDNLSEHQPLKGTDKSLQDTQTTVFEYSGDGRCVTNESSTGEMNLTTCVTNESSTADGKREMNDSLNLTTYVKNESSTGEMNLTRNDVRMTTSQDHAKLLSRYKDNPFSPRARRLVFSDAQDLVHPEFNQVMSEPSSSNTEDRRSLYSMKFDKRPERLDPYEKFRGLDSHLHPE